MAVPFGKIRALYDNGWSVIQIAEHLGVSRQAVHERMRREKVSYRPATKVRISKRVLERLYISEGLTIAAIAKRLGHSSKTIARELDRLGIERQDRRPRKPTGVKGLGIGDRLEIETDGDFPYRVYAESKRLKIRVVVRRRSAKRFAVIRTPLLSEKAVRTLAEKGNTLKEIAGIFHADTKTIRRYLGQSS